MDDMDLLDLLKASPPQTFLLDRGYVKDSDSFETVLVLKEEDRYLKLFGNKPVFDFRVGVFDSRAIVVVGEMCVNNNDNMLYETFYNYHWSEGKIMFDELVKQDKLHLLLYNEHMEMKRLLVIQNPFKYALINGKEIFKNRQWSMEDFDMGKEKIYNEYKSPKELFDYFGDTTGI